MDLEEDVASAYDIRYEDFFLPPNSENSKPKKDTREITEYSTFEKKQAELQKQINIIEEQQIAPKPWEYRGEVVSHMRDTDELLEKNIDIEYIREVQLPQEEIQKDIEEIIRQRIHERVFDDVSKRIRQEERPQKEDDNSNKIQISQEKSTYGLADIYEKEYRKTILGERDDIETKLQLQHSEISTMFANLCHKLDSLTNFFYTPKVPIEELQVVHSAPSLQVEEIIPINISNSQRVAPQEIFQPTTHGLLASTSEQTREERRALRKSRLNKRQKYLNNKYDELVILSKSGDKHAKETLDKIDLQKRAKHANKKGTLRRGYKQDSTKYSTSTQFFKKVQDNSAMQV